MSEDMLRNFFLGFIKIHILHHAGEAPVYGLAMMEELRRHGYHLSPGTLYPVLHQLEQAGYLSRLERVVNGKARKYYRLTRRGTVALAEVREKTAELVGEVFAADIARRTAKARRGTERVGRTRGDRPAASRVARGASSDRNDRRRPHRASSQGGAS
jgi:DNA-binding PadR family transcriptional regulator